MRLLSARLSAKRRSPLAGLVVLALALLLTGGIFVGVRDAVSPAAAADGQADQSTIEQGRALFLVGCASCHGKNGAVDFQVGTGRMPLARPGVQAQRKKVVYSPEEISQLAAYVASLGPGPPVPAKSDYDPTAIPKDQRNEAIVRGGQFFKTNCTACHNFAASGGALPGGKFAPSLKGVTDKHIYEAMLTGPQQMPVFSNGVVKPEEKREIIAYLNSIENDPGYGGTSLGALGPVSEGLTAWLVGIGACVAFAVWIGSSSVRSKKGIKS